MRKISYFMFALGTLLIAASMAVLLCNLREEQNAGILGDEVNAQISAYIETEQDFSRENDVVPDYILNPEIEMAKVAVEDFSYIGSLSIPVLGLELPIMDQWSYAGLKVAPGRYTGSAYSEPFVICGHNYKTHFGTLSSLVPQDQIVFTDMDGNGFEYRVEEIVTVDPYQRAEVVDGKWALTLFTCTPGGKTRVVVHCSSAGDKTTV